METFHKLFGSLLGFVYHCFDRIVIQGYLPLLTRPEHIVHFFRDLHGLAAGGAPTSALVSSWPSDSTPVTPTGTTDLLTQCPSHNQGLRP